MQLEILPRPPDERAGRQSVAAVAEDLQARLRPGRGEGAVRRRPAPATRCMTKRFVGDEERNVNELLYVEVEWVKGATAASGRARSPAPRRCFPADLVLLAMGFVGPEKPMLQQLGVEARRARQRLDRRRPDDQRPRRVRRRRHVARAVAGGVGDPRRPIGGAARRPLPDVRRDGPAALKTRDLHVESIRPLIPPAILLEELPLGEAGSPAGRRRARRSDPRACSGDDDRLLVVVGPCSIHDPDAALRVRGSGCRSWRRRLSADLCVVMRVYFEKPRTTVGWKGLINDPHLDGVVRGQRRACAWRGGCCSTSSSSGCPSGCEFLDPITPQFIADLVTWGAIGARTTESQVHRELASGSLDAGRVQERHRRRRSRSRSTRCGRRAIRTGSSASPSRGWPASSRRAATPTATSSCAAGATGPNYDAATVAEDARRAAGRRRAGSE